MRHESPDNIHFPRVHKLIHAPIKPETPPHIGAALKSKNVGDWIDCLFAAYDKMHRTGTLSLPFPQTQLDKDTAILRPRLTCEVRITDSDNYYELKVRLCADGSRMVVGIDYDLSFAPVIDGDTLLLMIAVATSKRMKFYFLDISNAFQSNIIHDDNKRHYIHLPSMYMKWFKLRFPNHPLSMQKDTSEKMIMQTIMGMQGTKDAGAEWYKLLSLILTKDMNMVPATGNKGLFTFIDGDQTAFIALATDDILLATSNKSFYDKLKTTFDTYFAYTTCEGSVLQFLNYRIIQSEYGTSVDQFNHIRQTILKEFFAEGTKVPFQSSPFILTQSIEMELFKDGPLSEQECAVLDDRYNGTYSHWTGAILHIAEKSRWDLQYLGMRLAGYNNCPSATCYRILYLGMCYIHHHPHVPIMFPCTPIKDTVPLKSHFAKGEAEMTTKDYAEYTGLQAWPDAGFARDIFSARRSTSSSIHTWGEVAFASQCIKQPEHVRSIPIWNSFFIVAQNSADLASSPPQSVLTCCVVLFILLSCIRKNLTMSIGGLFCGVGNCHIFLDFASRISRTAMNPRIDTSLRK